MEINILQDSLWIEYDGTNIISILSSALLRRYILINLLFRYNKSHSQPRSHVRFDVTMPKPYPRIVSDKSNDCVPYISVCP